MASSAREWFLQILDAPPDQRERLLVELRRKDPKTHAKVERLLEAHSGSGPLDVSRQDGDSPPWEQPPGPIPSLPAGTVLGDYEILSEIASGGAGVVYRARQISLNRIVALKFLRVGEFATKREVERFRAEAEAAARLDHPNIVPVFAVGQLEGRHYFSMKLVEGRSLSEEFARLRQQPRDLVRLLVTIAQAVHHAHQRGLLHRDIKPSNILLDEDGTPYVADFGIAKRIDPGEDRTETGWALGTPAYMAPEQITPSKGEVTVQTDVYGLGCLLYQALAGHQPFQGHNVSEVFRKVMEEAPPPISKRPGAVPRDLETIALKCLSKEPELRYASALQLADDLERWLNHEPIRARQSNLMERLWLIWRRKPVATSLGAAVILLVVVLAVGASVASLLLRQNLERAQRAEQSATHRLRAALVAQARANRSSGLPGQRLASLGLLEQAAEIEPGQDLVDEAVASLLLSDLRLDHEWPVESSDPIATLMLDGLESYALGVRGGRVEIRRIADNRMLGFLPGHGPDPWYMAASSDNRYLAVKYHDPQDVGPTASVRVWDLESRRTVLDLPTAISGQSIAFLPGTDLLLLGDDEGGLTWWDVTKRQKVREVGLPDYATALAPNPVDRQMAVAIGRQHRFQIRDQFDGRLIREIQLPGIIFALDWSFDGRLLAVGSGFDLHVFEAATWTPLGRYRGHNAEIVEVYFSPRSPLLATYSWDETTRLWHAVTGEQLLRAPVRARGFSKDGGKLAYRTKAGFGVWTVLHEDMFRTLYGHSGKNPSRAVFSPDGRWLASAGTDGLILWESDGYWPARVLSTSPTEGLFFHPLQGHLYGCTQQGLLRWELPPHGPLAEDLRPETVLGPTCERVAVDDSGRNAALLQGEEVVLIDLQDPQKQRRLRAIKELDSLSLTPDGSLLAAGNWRGDRVQVWNTGDGSVQAVLCRGLDSVRVGFSPDGKLLITGSNLSYKAWEVETWRELYSIERPLRVSNIAGLIDFDEGSGLMAITSSVRQIQLADPRSGQPLMSLETPDALVFEGLRFSPSGDLLAGISGTNRIQIWNLRRIRQRLRQLHLSGPPPGTVPGQDSAPPADGEPAHPAPAQTAPMQTSERNPR
ncbi:MAG TPA: serine/threonine-protein kinase [Acidobacteriota bacterium]|nr:serine/threonine-protein kinase [Acidobacteriota bacterium]